MCKLYRFLLPVILGVVPVMVHSQSFLTGGGPIPDTNTETCFPIVVSGLPSQIDTAFGLTTLCFDITHTYVGDLKITLKAPDNTTVLLANHVGGSGNNFTSTCLAEDGQGGYLLSGTAPFSGFYIPQESLNLVNNGMDPNGTWYLCITDEVPADAGNLNYGTLFFNNNPPPDPVLPPNICTTSNAFGCECPDTSLTVCDLLPDMTASALIIQNQHTEYPGYMTLSNATPNIGYGPLEIRGINVCYCDTMVVGCGTPVCPDGSYPKQMITQRIYQKDGPNMSTYDHAAGTMTYHPTHGHMHVDNWATYTLRVGTNDPDPLNWPVVGDGSKVSYCLVNLGSCSGSPGYCVDSAGNTITGANIPNNGLGSVTGCGNQQGIYAGSLDIYSQGLPGQQIDFPGICNGDYFVISHTDPYNNFIEMNDNNNHAVVPITLTLQGTPPANPAFSFVPNGLTVSFSSSVPGVTAYNWDFGDGDSANVPAVVHTFPAAGTYVVMLELFNGTCNAYVAHSVTVEDPTGTDEPGLLLTDVNIAPNPFMEDTGVTYKLSRATRVEATVYNVLGEVVVHLSEGIKAAGKHALRIENLPAGTFLFRLKTESNTTTHRIVKLK